MTFHPNNAVTDVSLKDAFNLHTKDIFLNLNCHAIARIQSFDSTKQTAIASVNYKKTYYVPDSTNGEYVPKLFDYPLMADCPVLFAGGLGGAITAPVQPGDDCLVFFNDRDLSNWFEGSTTSGNASPSLHSFADGIIFVGLRNKNNFLTSFDTDGVTLRTKDGTTKVKVFSDGSKVQVLVGPTMTMELSNTGTFKLLNAAGQDLITTLMNLFTNSTVLGVPIVPSPADYAVLTSFKP